MRILVGVQFLFVKAPVYKGFHIPFNDNRLYGDSEMVTVEPFLFYPSISAVLAVGFFDGVCVLLPVELYNSAIFHGNTSFRCSKGPFTL